MPKRDRKPMHAGQLRQDLRPKHKARLFLANDNGNVARVDNSKARGARRVPPPWRTWSE